MKLLTELFSGEVRIQIWIHLIAEKMPKTPRPVFFKHWVMKSIDGTSVLMYVNTEYKL